MNFTKKFLKLKQSKYGGFIEIRFYGGYLSRSTSDLIITVKIIK